VSLRIDQSRVRQACLDRIEAVCDGPSRDDIDCCLADVRALLLGAYLADDYTVDKVLVLVKSQLPSGNYRGAMRVVRDAIPERAPGRMLGWLRRARARLIALAAAAALAIWVIRAPRSIVWVGLGRLTLFAGLYGAALFLGWRRLRGNPHLGEAVRLESAVEERISAGKIDAAIDSYRELRHILRSFDGGLTLTIVHP
jgi:hypothetical protein